MSAGSHALTRGRSAVSPGALRRRAASTPGRLALISSVVAVTLCLLGAGLTADELSRQHAASAVRTETEPLLARAVTLYTALSDANATATATFLSGGLEPPARRARYLQDLRAASDALAALTGGVGASPRARGAVRTTAESLPVYSGLVEAARTDNRLGLPVGAAYLRQASALLTGTILPAADRLFTDAAQRLSGDYATGTRTATLIVSVAVLVLGLALLGLALLALARLSRRVVNLPTAFAAVVFAAVTIWSVLALHAEQGSLGSARRASDSVELLSATRVLLSRAQSDQSLTLVNRGSDAADPLDFAAVMRELGGPGGLLAGLDARAGSVGDIAAARLRADFDAYRAEAARIAALQLGGLTKQATTAASSASTRSLTDALNAEPAAQSARAQRSFATAAADAGSSLSGLAVAIPALIVIAAALVVVGVRQRQLEYR